MYSVYAYLGESVVTVCVSSKKILNVIKTCKAKYCKMVIDLKMIIETFADDPNNSWSVQHMIMSLRSASNKLSPFCTDKELRNAKEVSDVFLFISQHCNIYDYEVLEIFVMSTECEDAVKVLTDFTQYLENSLLMNLNLLSDEDLRNKLTPHPCGNRRKLTIECRGRSIRLEDKRLIQGIICEEFTLSEGSIQFVTAKGGSVYLIFEISLKVKEHLLQCKITASAVASFSKYKIIRLIIDDEVELKVSAEYDDKVYNWFNSFTLHCS